MNYLIPVYRANNKLDIDKIRWYKDELNRILDQQIMITKLSNSFSYRDTEEMDEYERIYVLKKLIQMRKEENEAKEKAIAEARNKK